MAVKQSWEAARAKCQKILSNSIRQEWLLPESKLPPASQLNVSTFIETSGHLTPEELSITSSSAVDLVEQMSTGNLMAVEVVSAFLRRAHLAHQLTNFATEFLADSALADAAALDTYFAETGKIKGPLHGVPISVKEHIGIKGRVVHSAYAAWVDNVAEEDAHIVKYAKDAGAVVHVRTNVPHTLLNFDCVNPLYGRSRNPHNRSLTPGGSSGGEGVSLALRCAPIGIGTDVGASIRLPAAFCGSIGLRTTALRNPFNGILLTGAGNEGIRCVSGPLANNTADIDLFQRAVLEQQPWETETSLVPIPWKQVKPYAAKDITIGVIWEDGLVRPHPPIQRGLRHTVDKLKAAGVKVVDFEAPSYGEAVQASFGFVGADGGLTIRELLAKGGEPVTPVAQATLDAVKPEWLPMADVWDMIVKRDAARDSMQKIMKERGVDFLLTPVFPGVASTEDKLRYAGYTFVYNYFDMPCASFQTGLKVDQKLDVVEEGYKPTNPLDEAEYQLYDGPATYADAPIALQLVGKHMRDEETLAATEFVSQIVQSLGSKL